MPIEEGFRQNFIGAARKNLIPFSDRIVPFGYGQQILPGIQAVDAAGHSPGHAAYLIASGKESLLHVGDVFHHEAFDLEHSDWATAFDQDAKAAYRTRLRMLDQAAADKSFLMYYHVPFPAIGYVRKRATATDGKEPRGVSESTLAGLQSHQTMKNQERIALPTGDNKGLGLPGSLKNLLFPQPQTRYAAGSGARAILWLRKMLPDRAFDRLMLSQMK
jgi:glyoxylase-like metal-dependent hydrolase (beta-lactamase superfamily II)